MYLAKSGVLCSVGAMDSFSSPDFMDVKSAVRSNETIIYSFSIFGLWLLFFWKHPKLHNSTLSYTYSLLLFPSTQIKIQCQPVDY